MIRIGQGYDIHRFTQDAPLVLGGFHIFDSPQGLLGHSDADALIHAVIDGILGALALGDIGQWFPDTDPQLKGISSGVLLTRVLSDARVSSWRIVNVDSTVITQHPKLAPHIVAIRRSLAELLHVDVNCVSVKAKTREHLDGVGQGLALETTAVVLLEQ